jgi:uncharacterized membrane protein YkvA (DUF1232 family)
VINLKWLHLTHQLRIFPKMSNQDNPKVPKDTSAYQKNYNDNAFWETIKTYAKKLGGEALYNALLLYYVMQDPNTPTQQKLMIAGTLGYLILPIDLIPDFIPVLGLTDDISALVAAVKMVAANISPQHQEMAKAKIREWFGEEG